MFNDRLGSEAPDDSEKPSYEPEEIGAEPTAEDGSENSFMGRMSGWFAK